MKPKLALIFLLIVSTITPAFAQVGGVVFDPTNYKNAVLRYLQLQQQLQQMQQTYNLHMQQYQFIVGQARQLQNMQDRYRAQFSQWSNLTAGNTLGNTSRWVNGINSGDYGTARQGYGQVNKPLGSPAGVNTYDSLKQAYGLEELSDGST